MGPRVVKRRSRGLLDTCVVIDLPRIDPALLPVEAAVPSVVLAELAQDVAMTTDPVDVLARAQRLADVEAEFAAIPFDREAARRFGTLAALTVKAKRDPRPVGATPAISRDWSKASRCSPSEPHGGLVSAGASPSALSHRNDIGVR